MKISKVKISDIKPYFNNPRDNSNAVSPTMESIRRYGFIKPIICDKEGVIICGHTRYLAAFRLGHEYVPVIYSDMDEEKAKHFRIADNKVAEKSEYDEEKLYNEIRNLEIPEEMQAFFFEDINHLLNFQFNATDINDQYLQDEEDEEYLYDQSDESSEEGGIAVSKDEDDTEDYSEDDYSEDDDKVSSENLHDEIYKVKVINGVRSMKVICPYCGNLETIKLD